MDGGERWAMRLSLIAIIGILAFVPPAWADGPGDAAAGYAALERGEFDEAIMLFTRAIGSGELSKEELADAYNRRGTSYDHAGDLGRAIADYDRAIEVKPDFWKPYGNRGTAYHEKGEYERAFSDLTKSIDLSPEPEVAYFRRGVRYHDRERYDEAIADFDQVINFEPGSGPAYVYRGHAYLVMHNYDNAIADFGRAIDAGVTGAEIYR
jgi:tetratricopeptide (TPR) repeat protein